MPIRLRSENGSTAVEEAVPDQVDERGTFVAEAALIRIGLLLSLGQRIHLEESHWPSRIRRVPASATCDFEILALLKFLILKLHCS
jgi:hypothetical protein